MQNKNKRYDRSIRCIVAWKQNESNRDFLYAGVRFLDLIWYKLWK